MTIKELARFEQILRKMVHEEPLEYRSDQVNFNGIELTEEEYKFIEPFLEGEVEHTYKFGNTKGRQKASLVRGIITVTEDDGTKKKYVDITGSKDEWEYMLRHSDMFKQMVLER